MTGETLADSVSPKDVRSLSIVAIFGQGGNRRIMRRNTHVGAPGGQVAGFSVRVQPSSSAWVRSDSRSVRFSLGVDGTAPARSS